MSKKIPTIQIETDGRKHIKLYSYAVLLTEKNGGEVKAIRFDGYQNKADVRNDCPDDWNIKTICRLYEEDFE